MEMRVFSLDDLKQHFLKAGFQAPELLNDYVPEFGIDWRGEYCSIPMVTRAV